MRIRESGYADAPLSAPTILRGSNEPRFLLTLREPRAPHLAPQSSVAYIKYASLLFRGNLGHPEPARSYDPIRCQEPQWPRRPLAIGRRGLPLNPSRSAPGMSSTPSAQSHIRGYRSGGPQSSPSAGVPQVCRRECGDRRAHSENGGIPEGCPALRDVSL